MAEMRIARSTGWAFCAVTPIGGEALAVSKNEKTGNTNLDEIDDQLRHGTQGSYLRILLRVLFLFLVLLGKDTLCLRAQRV